MNKSKKHDAHQASLVIDSTREREGITPAEQVVADQLHREYAGWTIHKRGGAPNLVMFNECDKRPTGVMFIHTLVGNNQLSDDQRQLMLLLEQWGHKVQVVPVRQVKGSWHVLEGQTPAEYARSH